MSKWPNICSWVKPRQKLPRLAAYYNQFASILTTQILSWIGPWALHTALLQHQSNEHVSVTQSSKVLVTLINQYTLWLEINEVNQTLCSNDVVNGFNSLSVTVSCEKIVMLAATIITPFDSHVPFRRNNPSYWTRECFRTKEYFPRPNTYLDARASLNNHRPPCMS